MRRSLVVGVAVCATWLTVSGAGCNLFRPDDPEPPKGNPIIPDYSSPDQTLDMIAQAVTDKARNNGSSIYIDAFADTALHGRAYRHFFWTTDVQQLGITPPPEWATEKARQHELTFYSRLIALRGDEYVVIWVDDPLTPSDIREEEGWAEIHRHYEITSETEDGSFTGTIAVGFADLFMVKGTDDQWRIVTWNDRVDTDADPGAEEVTLGRRRLTIQ